MKTLTARLIVLTLMLLGSKFSVLSLSPVFAQEQESTVIVSEAASFQIETVATGLKVPWAMEFLPDGDALVVERDKGHLHRLNVGSGVLTSVSGLPEMLRDGKISSGLFDVRLHPDFEQNGWIYVIYGVGSAEANGLALDRFKLKNNTLTDRQPLLQTTPRISGKWHFGGRLVFSKGYLYLTTGDGYAHSHLAQSLSAHAGKVLRLHDNGEVPEDNPFVNVDGALPEVWSYGIRSPQGLAVHPLTNQVWLNEHGPQGGDEVNIIEAGVNYGWPVISYGEEYGGGPIGEGITRKEGMQQPLYYWRPSIAPSGMEFYSGEAFPGWKGSLFNGALALKHINRLALEGERVIHEERLLEDKDWRVRFIEEGPEGFLYFGIDDGMIMRLVPAK